MESLSHILEALVIVLREGIEAALVVGIVLAWLQGSGRSGLQRPVWAAVAAAIATSAGIAVLLQLLGVDAENQALEGTMYVLAALMVGTLVGWMWRQGRSRKGEIESRLGKMMRRREGKLGAGAAVALFAFVFLMVVREGVETAIFMLALGGTQGALGYNLAGGALGLGLAAAFGVLLFKGSLRINLQVFFSVTAIVLLALAVKLLAGGLHEFDELGWLPPGSWTTPIGWLAQDSISAYILMALIGAPALLILRDSLKCLRPGRQAVRGLGRHQERRSCRWGIATAAVGVAIVIALGFSQLAQQIGDADEAPPQPAHVQAPAGPPSILPDSQANS